MEGFMQCLACLLLMAVIVSGFEPKTCSKASDCAPDECCRIGMERYAMPECMPRGRIDEDCREGAESEDRLLYYPNMILKYVEDVYTLFCPCEERYDCKHNKCTVPAVDSSGSAAGSGSSSAGAS